MLLVSREANLSRLWFVPCTPAVAGTKKQNAYEIWSTEVGLGLSALVCSSMLCSWGVEVDTGHSIPLSMADIGEHQEMGDGQFHVMKQGGALRRGASDDPDDSSGTSRLKN